MAGVAGPMLRTHPAAAFRFLVGFTAGAAIGGLVLALGALLLGRALHTVLTGEARIAIVATLCGLLGLADLLNRTPHIWRQVPQALARSLPPGFLGVVWGIDIGLLFTTQKTSSLIWVAISAVVLLHPAGAPALLVAMALVTSLAIGVGSVGGPSIILNHGTRRDRIWLRAMRVCSASLLLALCIVIGTQAFGI